MVKPFLEGGNVIDGADPLADPELAARGGESLTTADDGDDLVGYSSTTTRNGASSSGMNISSPIEATGAVMFASATFFRETAFVDEDSIVFSSPGAARISRSSTCLISSFDAALAFEAAMLPGPHRPAGRGPTSLPYTSFPPIA